MSQFNKKLSVAVCALALGSSSMVAHSFGWSDLNPVGWIKKGIDWVNQ